MCMVFTFPEVEMEAFLRVLCGSIGVLSGQLM